MFAPLCSLSFNSEEVGIMLGCIDDFIENDYLEVPKSSKKLLKKVLKSAYLKLSSKQTQFTVSEIEAIQMVISFMLDEVLAADSADKSTESYLEHQTNYYKAIFETILSKLDLLKLQGMS